jgi:phosphopantothenoylcysteine decarboxylase/phosphopantothenate--cysteine ligase
MNPEHASPRILLGVTGGIAAYKALELARLLERRGFSVDVVLTEAATAFVTPLSFRALVSGVVLCPDASTDPFAHLRVPERADLFVIVPATANTLTKIAHGFADNLLLTMALAFRGPLIVCPAMNVAMWGSEPVKEAMRMLDNRGVRVVPPARGELACGDVGEGRLADLEEILATIEDELARSHDFEGVTALVTAGPTREYLDDVRFLSNASSGKMGYAIARELLARGARVILVSGPTGAAPPEKVEFVSVTSARDMHEACLRYASEADLIFLAAAVADFEPEHRVYGKIRKDSEEKHVLTLTQTPDIAATLGARKREDQLLVGFSLETEELERRSREKLERKNLDLVVANYAHEALESEQTTVTILDRAGVVERLENVSKRHAARAIVDAVRKRMARPAW